MPTSLSRHLMERIFKHSRAIVVMILAGSISGLIANSYTHWWSPLAALTNAVWQTVALATVNAMTYRIPIWILLISVALIALTWYATRKSGRALKVNPPKFLTYRQDYFDGVLCRWDYSRESLKAPYSLNSYSITCYCQHCDFNIGTPNDHLQQCPSCSRRAVRSERDPYRTPWGAQITGYQSPNSMMPFQEFIQREIDRRLRNREEGRHVQ